MYRPTFERSAEQPSRQARRARATIETGQARPRFGIVIGVSGVVLVSESGSTTVFAGLIARAVNQYIRSGDHCSFHETFTVRNLFG
jgi:hypothetical protein